MAIKKNEWSSIEKTAKDNGYKWNSDRTHMSNGSDRLKPSATGGSATVSGSKYTDKTTLERRLGK